MRPLVGPHLAGLWANKLDILRQWQPPLVLLLQPEADKVQQLRAVCPNTIIVGRFYHDDSHYDAHIGTRPADFAYEIHREIIANPATPLLDYVQSNNEVCQDWLGIQNLNTFTERWMALADESRAYKCAILAFSNGNPDMPYKPGDPAGFDGRMLYWQQVLPSLNYAQRHGHILLLHAYGYPDMFHPAADWHIYRYERQVQANLRTLGITSLKYAYGEIGIDRLIVKDKGGYKSVPTSDQGYVNQLLQWERDQQGQSLLLGGAIFTFGDSGGWGSYDITSTNVAHLLAQHYDDHAADYASPDTADSQEPTFMPHIPNESTTVAPQLPPREWDERLTQRGVTVVTPQVATGRKFWRVVKGQWFSEAEAGGRHHIYVDALLPYGEPVEGVPFRVNWPSGSDEKQTNARDGFDAANFPMSPSLQEFSVFIADNYPSEYVRGIGMGANGNPGIHTSTLVTFQLATMPQAQQPAPTPAPTPPPIIAPGPTPPVPQEPKAAYVVATAGANLRQSPDVRPGNIILAVPYGSGVVVKEERKAGNGTRWARVGYQNIDGWMAADLLGDKPLEVAPPPSTPQPAGIIEPATALAFLQVESANRAFEGGLMVIRFEVHRFKANLKNDRTFDIYFKFTPGDYAEQYWRKDEGGAWRHAHGNQHERHELLKFARNINNTAALRSTGMGLGQVMGENHARIGYATPQAMFNAFSHPLYGVNAQVLGFMSYVYSDPALLDALRRGDWHEAVTKYNGDGQQHIYVPKLEKARAKIMQEIGA